jgi:DNA-binding IclR family transcriptional regulator
VGVVDGFMLEALLLRIYLWQLEGTPVTVSMLSRSLGVSRATCRRKLATLIEWEFIKREGQTYRIVVWMGEADQRRMLNRITAILSHATTEMALAKLATSVAH